MTSEVKIVSFRLDDHDPGRAEKELTALVKQGWVIVTAGGGGGGYGGGGGADHAGDPWGIILQTGFVVLQKDL